MHFERLRNTRTWREIPRCPGRSVRVGADPELDGWMRAYATRFDAATPDPVWIWRLPGGGAVLSYERPDGSWVHTLGTDEGLRRKCAAIGIDLDGWICERSAGLHVDGPWRVVVTSLGPDRGTALQLVRRMFPFRPVAEAMAALGRLPLARTDLSRHSAVEWVREIEAAGGSARAIDDGADVR